MAFQENFRLTNLKYPLYVLTIGPVFYLVNYYKTEALKCITINKIISLNYLPIVFVFILSYVFLEEKVYLLIY